MSTFPAARILAAALYRIGACPLLDAWWGPTRLTVLAYHRVGDATVPDFAYYRSAVSASPEAFAWQMAYVAENFHVIDLLALSAFIQHGHALPPRPLLITFDDGYLDNYTHAYPVLRAHGFSAVIFLVTSQMDDPRLPWWDECAYYFHHTRKGRATLPLIGECSLTTPDQRAAACKALMHRLRQIPEVCKQGAMRDLPETLDVDPPPPDPTLFLSWARVRELVANGVACQPHTVTHPILTRTDLAEVRRQLAEARARIEAQTGQEVTASAYPNGMPGDYDETTLQAFREAGYKMAFTLLPGPMRAVDVLRHPLQIARVSVCFHHTFEMFVMRVLGLPALLSRPAFVQEVTRSLL